MELEGHQKQSARSLLCEVFALRDIRKAGRTQRTFVVMRHLRYGMRHPEAWQYFDLKGVGGERKAAWLWRLAASAAPRSRRAFWLC